MSTIFLGPPGGVGHPLFPNLLTNACIGLPPSPIYFLTLLLVLPGTISPQNHLSPNPVSESAFKETHLSELAVGRMTGSQRE